MTSLVEGKASNCTIEGKARDRGPADEGLGLACRMSPVACVCVYACMHPDICSSLLLYSPTHHRHSPINATAIDSARVLPVSVSTSRCPPPPRPPPQRRSLVRRASASKPASSQPTLQVSSTANNTATTTNPTRHRPRHRQTPNYKIHTVAECYPI